MGIKSCKGGDFVAGVLGIYVHIPFCAQKCDYCDFYSMSADELRMEDYHKALLTQIKQMAATLRGQQVDTIYFGGGTPSYYGERRLREVLLMLQKQLSVCRTPEITVECNPDSVDKKSLIRLRKAGVNRISLGMQTADEEQLQALGRIHSMEQVEQAVREIREAKIENLSLDLMLGVPGQTMESLQETVRKAISLEPDHISAYGLKLEEGTPLQRRVEEGEQLPDDDLQADMYLWTVEQLRATGYRQYELSNFAKTGRESRHNLKYWMGRDYIGFGPGAHSDFGGRRYAYARDLDEYIRGVLMGTLVPEEEGVISKVERAREYLMLRLRTLRGIEEWEYRREFTMNFEPLEQRMELFESRGWMRQSGRRWHCTPEGFLLSNQLIGELLEVQGQTVVPESGHRGGRLRFWDKETTAMVDE